MFNYQHWGAALFLFFAFVLELALLILPGFAIASMLGSRRKVAPVYFVITVMATTATLGYISFWLFFLSRLAGKVFTFLIYALTLFSTIRNASKPELMKKTIRNIALPFFFMLLAGFCYLSLLYLFGDPQRYEAGLAGARFFETAQPGDNIIPLLFAERIYNHAPLRPFCCGDWLSSDRPPLQASIFLLEQPLRLIGIGTHYQLLGTTLQGLWICSVWCLLTVLETPDRRIRQIMVILICSGFFFYNSVYVWPKLLAAAYILFVLSILLDAVQNRCHLTIFQIVLAAVCLSLALLAHPGCVFSLPAFGIVVWRFRYLLSLRKVALTLGIVLAFYLPWSAYQKFVDPPGNRLLKMHLAGEFSPDSRSTWQAVTEAYRCYSWRKIADFKLLNVAALLGDHPPAVFIPNSLHRSSVTSSRTAQREWIWNDVGLLNIGWVGAVWQFFQRRRCRPVVPYSPWLLMGSIFNLIIWSLALFGPAGTRMAHSSYADLILLSIGLCGYLLSFPTWIALAVFALEIWNLIVVWSLFPPATNFPRGTAIEAPFLVFGTLALGILTWIFIRACFRCVPPEQGCTLL